MSYATGDSLKVRIRIAFGAVITDNPSTWTWTDVTQWWHVPDDVTITWGRSSGAEQAEPSTLSLTFKNDGRFTAYDARSLWWPHVRKWTPITYDIDLGDGAGWRNRFSGYVRKWPLTWPGGSDRMALAKIAAVGVLGRLGRSRFPLQSALRRYLPGTNPVAWWPLEDGSESTQAASGIPGGRPMRVRVGQIQFDADGPPGAAGAAIPSTDVESTISGDVVGASATAWQVAVWFRASVDAPGSYAGVMPVRVETPNMYFELFGQANTASTVVVGLFGTGPSEYLSSTGPTPLDGRWHLVQFRVSQVGGNAAVVLVLDGVQVASNTFTGYTVGPVTRIDTLGKMLGGVGAVFNVRDVAVSHISVHNGASVVSQYVAGTGYTGETSTARLARLCAELGVPLTVTPGPDPAEAMGPQRPATAMTLWQECETADVGLIDEAGWGLGYLARSARYNPALALALDAALGQLGEDFEPVDDDDAHRNVWVVERVNGSSAEARDDDSIRYQGEIGTSVQVNIASDLRLGDHAGWRLRMTTPQEPRYPALSFTVSARRELSAQWVQCRPGSRVQVLHPPPQHVPGGVDQLIAGATEVYRGRRWWQVTLNVEPASPWLVAEVDGGQRVTSETSTLATGYAATGTGTLSLAFNATQGRWTTDPADFPLDLRVGGEQVRVSAITGTSSPQTATVTARGLNGVQRSWPSGAQVDVWDPAVVSL
ncbi:hypothetical protein [Micromonospora sp. NPDC003816]|uniref:hypothetical protein n=1 Tax=Micromonospora sp. NPDC003816 TaxID=3364224 RepID=UPI0036AA2344